MGNGRSDGTNAAGRTRLLLFALFAAGALERLWWAISHWPTFFGKNGEMYDVAIAFARTGAIADAYRVGQGPTAHVTPVMPILVGSVYRLLGVTTPVAEAVLAACSVASVLASFWVGYRAFRAAGSPRAARLLALAALLLLPTYAALEINTFRYWEGGLATLLGLGTLLLVQGMDRDGRTELRWIAILSLACAITFFVTPPVGLGAYGCAALFGLARVPPRRWPGAALVAIVVLAAVLAPWTIRNAHVFGRFIPLRDNAGLELALGMQPAAIDPADPAAVFDQRWHTIHPLFDSGYARMQAAGGEYLYAQQLGAEAKAFMRRDPVGAARIMARHGRDYFFPTPYVWRVPWHGPFGRGAPQMMIRWITALFGCAGAILALGRGRRWAYPAIMLFLPALPYLLTEPTIRYSYIGVALMTYFAADLVVRLADRLLSGRPPATRDRPGGEPRGGHAPRYPG